MKTAIKFFLQKLFGLERYLYIFANFIIYTLPFNRKERDFLHFIKGIKQEGIVLDIGANIGIMSYHLSRKRPKTKIYAIEPIPVNFRVLEKIVKQKKLSNVHPQFYALGNENGECQMVLPEVDKVQMQGLSHVLHQDLKDFNEGETFSSSIKKLDDLDFLKNGEALVAIKMDVENFEAQVLEGGRVLISKHKPLIYTELWENENRNQCFQILEELGYQCYVLINKKLQKFNTKEHHTQNFFFIHPQRKCGLI